MGVLFIIWASILFGIVLFQFKLGHGIPKGPDIAGAPTPTIVYVCFALIVLASIVRWILIPREGRWAQVLVLLVIGLALSEAVTFFEIFLIPADYPSTKLTLWVLSIVSCLQFIPLYALRLKPSELQGSGTKH